LVLQDLSDESIGNTSLSDLQDTLKYLRDMLDDVLFTQENIPLSILLTAVDKELQGDLKNDVLITQKNISNAILLTAMDKVFQTETIPQNMLLYSQLIDGIRINSIRIDLPELSTKPWEHLISNDIDGLHGWYLQDMGNGTYKEVYFK
jgi:hypothetical protein